MMTELQLRPNMNVNTALEVLERVASELRDIVASSGGMDPIQHAGKYLMWAEKAEPNLRHVFASPEVWEAIHTPRFEEIRAIRRDTLRPVPLVNLEADAQRDRFMILADRLKSEFQAFELPGDCVAVVPDTNIFLHRQRYDQIDWSKELGGPPVRLVVPEIVVDELDEKSYKSSLLSRRANEVLKSLRRTQVRHAAMVPVEVRAKTELQFLMDPEGHQRRSNADDEFLARAKHLGNIVGDSRLFVATGDLGMQLRAENRRLKVLSLEDKYLLPLKQE